MPLLADQCLSAGAGALGGGGQATVCAPAAPAASGFPLAAVAAAVAASMVFGAAAVAQQRAAHRVPRRSPLDPRLLVDMAGQPAWAAGAVMSVAGLGLQVIALHYGPLALVQPLLVCNVLFAVVISAALAGGWPPDRTAVAGAVCCAAGLGGFLALARPHAGAGAVRPLALIPLAAGLAVVVSACLAVARRGPRRARPLAIALACGVAYGVTAFLLKQVSATALGGPGAATRHWPLYALAVLAPIGFQLNQSAFQSGALIAPVLSVITIADPLVSIGISRLWLHETLAASPAAVAGEVASLAVMATGVAALARHAPQAAGHARRACATTVRARP